MCACVYVCVCTYVPAGVEARGQHQMSFSIAHHCVPFFTWDQTRCTLYRAISSAHLPSLPPQILYISLKCFFHMKLFWITICPKSNSNSWKKIWRIKKLKQSSRFWSHLCYLLCALGKLPCVSGLQTLWENKADLLCALGKLPCVSGLQTLWENKADLLSAGCILALKKRTISKWIFKIFLCQLRKHVSKTSLLTKFWSLRPCVFCLKYPLDKNNTNQPKMSTNKQIIVHPTMGCFLIIKKSGT